MLKNRKFIILIVLFIFSFFIFNQNTFSLNTQTEGFDLGYGTAKDIDVFSTGKNVRRSGSPIEYKNIFIPTGVLLEWDNFCANHPTDTNCCPVLSTNLGTGSSGYLNFNDCNFGCNAGYFHDTNVCTGCSYSAYANYDCLNTSVWQQSRSRTNGNDSECPVQYQTTANSCEYCTADGTENPSTTCSSHGSRTWTCALGNHTKSWSGCSCYVSTNSGSTITAGYFTGSASCDTACTYNAWSNYSCNSSSKWIKSATRSNGNDTNCPALTYTSTDTCAYCTASGADSCTITNGVGTNPYTCTSNNKVYSGCVVSTCNATYYKANTTTCSACGTGTWSPAGNTLGSCNSCTNMGAGGYAYTSNASSNACTYSCAQNYYGATGTACSACGAGTWTNAGNNASGCTACSYNGWTNTTCNSGNTWNATRTIASGNAAACTSTSTTNNGACNYCTAGGTDTAGCNNHGSRTYTCVSNNKNFGACTCNVSTNSGATITAGYFNSASYCNTACTYNAWGNYDCTSGSVWTKLASRSNGDATSCPDLTYTSADTCEYCSQSNGTYVSNATSQSCTITNGAGTQYKGYTCNSHTKVWDASWGTCTVNSCNAGYEPSGNTCVACVAGKYKASAGTAACSTCGAGYVTNTLTGTGATTCTQCAAGTYDNDSSSQTACSNCGAGYYCTGGTARTACAAGTSSSATTATSSATCVACATGTYSTGGAGSCSNCTNMGTGGYSYTSNATSNSCTYNCAQNYYGSSGTSCSACGAETWTSAGNNAASCSACAYSGYTNTTCNTGNTWNATRTITSGNASACTLTSTTNNGACVYCSAGGADSCGITNGTGTNPYSCTNNNKVYSGCVVATCNQNYYKSSSTTCSSCGAETWTSAGNTASSCSACVYNGWTLGNCLSNSYFQQNRTRSPDNSATQAACTATTQTSSYPCVYCSNPGGFCTTGSYPEKTATGQSSCSNSVCNSAYPGYYLYNTTTCYGCGGDGEDTYNCVCRPKCNTNYTCLMDGALGSCIVWVNANNCGLGVDAGFPACPTGYSCVGGHTCHTSSGCAIFTCKSHRICR